MNFLEVGVFQKEIFTLSVRSSKAKDVKKVRLAEYWKMYTKVTAAQSEHKSKNEKNTSQRTKRNHDQRDYLAKRGEKPRRETVEKNERNPSRCEAAKSTTSGRMRKKKRELN
jgi:hypothetical protein